MNPFHIRRIRPQRDWIDGNRIELLEDGEAYFPAVFEAIEQAQREVLVETFILFVDKVGLALQERLVAAASRGVSVDVTVDGYGSPDLTDEFIAKFSAAGVRLHIYDPRPRRFGLRTNLFRRLHRKIVVVDGELAFVGGINFSHDHLRDFGPEAKRDHAVRVRGPIVGQIHRFAREQLPGRRAVDGESPTPAPAGRSLAMFVSRDNDEHRNDIERQYRAAIRSARREVMIANAYFFPGYRLLKALRQAARRGVRVNLIVQGEPDMPLVKRATDLLYAQLVLDGVRIFEYCERPMHTKVALVDDHWATVGSSNLDPLSLAFNLEANVMIRDAAFNDELRGRLQDLIDHHCKAIEAATVDKRTRWRVLLDTLAFHFTRHFPSWAGWLPAHTPKLTTVEPGETPRWVEHGEREPVGRTR
jgi:cardiolipin synthase